MEFVELKGHLLEDANFSDKQWRELKAICDIRQGHYSEKASATAEVEVDVGSEHERLFYDRLKTILLDQEKVAVAPLPVLKRLQPKQYTAIKKLTSQLFQLSCDWNPTKTRGRNFAIGVYHLYIKLAVQYLKDCSVPLSAKAVLQHGDKFVGLVDKAFPGYVKSGLMHVIILGRKDGQPPA